VEGGHTVTLPVLHASSSPCPSVVGAAVAALFLLWPVVVVSGGGMVVGGWYSPRSVVVMRVVIVDGGERVEGCELRLWQFISHTWRGHNIFPK
jgi:hypothetical protein